MSFRPAFSALAAGTAVTLAATVLPATAQPPDSVAAGLRPLAVFDDYVNGSLRTQGSWEVNTPGAADGAFASADVPASLSGKALALMLDGDNPEVPYRGNAYAGLGALSVAADATAGTVFWEILTEDLDRTDLNLGLSSDNSPGLGADTTGDAFDLDDFGPQVTLDERGLVARDGDTDKVLDATVADGEVLRIWLTVDNVADTFSVHTAGPGEDATQASSGGDSSFEFRTSDGDALSTLLLLNDPTDLPTSDSFLDNIYVSPSQATTTDPSPQYADVLHFEDYSAGALGGQDGWVAPSATNATIAADPASAENQAVRIAGNNTSARRPMPSVSNTDTGTIFFRFRRDGLVDTSLGLTDVDAPTAFSDFRVQANNQRTGILQVRPASGFTGVGHWPEDAWQCVWMVADNATDTYRVYSRGGPYPTTTRLPVDQQMEYAFRSPTANPLDTFLLLQGANSPGTLWVDDLAIDRHSANLRVPSGDAGDCQVTGGSGDLPLTTPVKETPYASSVNLHLSEVTTIPASSASAPLARINYVSEVPGRPDVLAVPDLNGKTWLVEDGAPVEYFDMDAIFPDFVRSPSLGTGNGFIAFHPEFATNGLFYTVHTEAGAALTTRTPSLPAPPDTRVHGIVTEWHATDPSASSFSGTRRELLRIGYSRFLHGLQQIGFNTTAEPGDADYGKLYIASGDGDENPNFAPNPQDPGMPQGKILRIDPAGNNAPGAGYGIPADNPFVGEPGALGEVWAMGFRNPHRFSWDDATGRMYVGMIGEKTIDAVYEVRSGDNAGWNEREGSFVFKKTDTDHVYPLPANDAELGYDYPVLNIGRNTGGSLSGGFVYRGASFPELQGAYLFGDIVTGHVRFTSAAALKRGGSNPHFFNANIVGPDGQPTTMAALAGSSRVDLRFGSDDEGEIYLISKANGKVWKVTDVTGTDEEPSCDVGPVTVEDVNAGENWVPLTPSKWQFPGDQVILTSAGTAPTGPRRPYEYATLATGPEFGSVEINAQVRLDESTAVSNRDVVLIWNYQSPTRFYYTHLSQDNTIYPHNGIFVVDDADRLRIDDQWNEGASRGAPPAVDDMDWHDVRIVHCADTGRIAVYVDGSDIPLMTATDTTFTGGRVGFGSFDNFGRARDISVSGTPVASGEITGLEPTVSGTPVVDGELTADAGDVVPSDAVLAYQWYAGDTEVGDGTASYAPGPGDVGKPITVTVTANRDGYEPAEATSEATGPVAEAAFMTGPTASFTGVLKVGETLTAAEGTATPAPTGHSYQWLADGEPIAGATSSTYQLTAAEKGRLISVEVTALRPGYAPATAVSDEMGPVTTDQAPTVSLTASRTQARVGERIALTWTSTEAESLTASGGWTGTKPASGSAAVRLTRTGTATYILTATNANGSTQAAVAVEVALPPARFTVRAPERARAGKRVTVRVAGLAPRERYVVRIGGRKVAAGLASATGTAAVKVKVPRVARTKTVVVKVTGSLRDRVGTDRMIVRRR